MKLNINWESYGLRKPDITEPPYFEWLCGKKRRGGYMPRMLVLPNQSIEVWTGRRGEYRLFTNRALWPFPLDDVSLLDAGGATMMHEAAGYLNELGCGVKQ